MSNPEVVEKYLAERQANDIRPRTLDLDRVVLKRLNQSLCKPFKEVTKGDMIGFCNEIAKEGLKRGSIHTYKRKIKVFYNWLYGMNYKEYPECVKWMRPNNPRGNTKSGGRSLPIRPEDLLTQEDIKKLINACNHPRDQALISILYESAARAEEVVKLRVGSIIFDKFGAKVTLEGNTGARIIRLVHSVPYIQTWLNVHPYRDNPKAPLWCKIRKGLGKESIQYHNVRKLVVSLGKDVGIEKPCTPHKLRHARLTELAKHLPEQKLKVYAGWTPGSTMTGTYVHLSGKDLDDDILQLHGVTPKKPEKPLEKGALRPQPCVRCNKANSPTAQYCQFCGMILDENLALEQMNQEANIEELRKQLAELNEKFEMQGVLLTERIPQVFTALEKNEKERLELKSKIAGIENFQKMILNQSDKEILEFIKDVRRQLKAKSEQKS
jgi:integrase